MTQEEMLLEAAQTGSRWIPSLKFLTSLLLPIS